MFDLFQAGQQDGDDRAAVAPAASLGTTPGQAFSAAWEANTRYSSSMALMDNLADAAQDHLDAYQARTGETLPNPYRRSWNPLSFDATAVNSQLDDVRMRMQAGSQRVGDPSLALPAADQLYREGLSKGRAALAKQADLAGGQQFFGVGPASVAAGFASQFSNPIDAGLNAAAIATLPEGGGAIRAIAGAAASFGAQEAAQEALSFQYKQAVNPEYGVSDAAKDVVGAAVGGALLEGGGRALGGLWRTLRTKASPIAETVPLAAQDAGNAAERQADLDANNPFKGVPAAGAHAEAIAGIERNLARDEPVQLPAAAAAEGAKPTGEVFTAQPETQAVPQTVFVGKQGLRVKYELTEARDLVTSHDDDFRLNPNYPADLQPRDRSSKPAQDQVLAMAANLEPERLGPNVEANSGAPVVGPDNIVESGNGRAMAMRRAYDRGDAGAYRAFLERSGYDTTGISDPILIARRITPMSDEERAAFGQAANGSASLRMSATEQALSDARHVAPDITHLLQPGAIDAAANRDFVRAMVAKMPAGERGGMLTRDGKLSQGGVQRVKAALTARAYADPAFVARAFDHPDPNIKTIASALVDAAPDWIKMRDAVTRGDIPAGQDITDDMMQSVRSIMRARDEGRTVGDIMNQSDMFQSDTATLAARLFFKDNELKRFLSKPAMADNLSTFARDLLSRGGERDLFGEEPATAAERLKSIAGRQDAVTASMIAESNSPKAIEAAFADPKVAEAAQADLDRMIAQGKNRVPVATADGVELGFADKELHDLDRQLDLAKEVQACAMPVQEAAE